jgi:SRSO17 transposase
MKHHFIADGVWDAAPLESELLIQADRLVGGQDSVLIIDDTALPKKGKRSFGVAPQYASALGKTVTLSLWSRWRSSHEVPVMVGPRPFLPETWTTDLERMTRAHVPKDWEIALTKPEIAIEEIDRVIAPGVRFGCVLADSGYGSMGLFRQALTPVGATALVAEIGDWKIFSSGRCLAVWIGLVPKQHTTGGKDRLGSITKQGKLIFTAAAGGRRDGRYPTCNSGQSS